MRDIALLLGRLLMAYIFLFAGYNKAMHFDGTSQALVALGLPALITPLVILLEVGGGLALVLGAYTRVAAVLLGAFCMATAFLVHFHPGTPDQMLHFMKNSCMAGGFLALAAAGAGNFSLDARLKLRWR